MQWPFLNQFMTADPYASKDQTYFAQGRPEMLQFVSQKARRVLEVGCGRGHFLRLLKQRGNVHATGVEPFAEAAEQAEVHADVVLQTDIANALERLNGELFDTVIFNDVLEHLVDPWGVLASIRPLLVSGGDVVSSIPNVRYWPVLNALALHGEWRYVEAGVLDRTHLRFFTATSIRELFETSGYRVMRMSGINGTGLPLKAGILNRVLGGRFDDCRFPQFATVARCA
jgi:2-polyprenyl-3-methyl-5-hydroxy-6-metoxy-1,4-benzoquinol methylase